MKDRLFMSYRHHAIWYGCGAYMVAKGDGTDYYFSNHKDAMNKIDEIEDRKKADRGAQMIPTIERRTK